MRPSQSDLDADWQMQERISHVRFLIRRRSRHLNRRIHGAKRREITKWRMAKQRAMHDVKRTTDWQGYNSPSRQPQ